MAHVFFKRAGDPASVSVLNPGDRFRIYDDFFEDAFPATYLLKEWKIGKQICLAVNLDTGEEVYVFGRLEGNEYPEYKDKERIIMISSRALHKLSK